MLTGLKVHCSYSRANTSSSMLQGHLLGYSASDVDRKYLNEIPHLIIWPVQLHIPITQSAQAL